mgnify:CR=1 FL=1
MNSESLFHASEVTLSCSGKSPGTLWELCGNSAGTLWDLSGNSPGTPKAKSPWFAQSFQDFWQGAWARSVMEKWSRSNENDAPKSGKASKRLARKVVFNGKVSSKVTILDKFGQLCGDVWVIFHPVGGDFAWKSMNSGWLFMTLRWIFMLLELPGNSAGTPRKLQKPQIHDLRKGFRVFGKAHDSVMEKWPQSNENDAPKSGKKSKGSPQNMGCNGKVAPKVTIF